MFGCFVEAVYHGGVLESVHFEDDTALFAFVGKGDFTVDEAVQLGDEVEAGDEKGGELRAFLTLERAEEVVEVVHYLLAAGEESAVGVEGGGLLVEVAGTDVGVAGELFAVQAAAADEGYLGVDFQAGDAVYYFDAGGLHHFGGGEVVLFVETGFQFYEYGDFLAVLGSGYQGVDDGGVFGYTVLRHHDFTGFRVVNSFVEEVDEVLEGVVRVI
ncbi:unknown [Bacteroides sp. CAG:754]|nr:unknown [Bacteroides sp. CAG:754]